MAWFSWLKKKQAPEDYETILSNLQQSITSKEQRLSEIRLRERRATLVVTLYAFGGWVLYLVAWWTVLSRWKIFNGEGVRRGKDKETLDRIVKGVPAFVGPVVILFIRRIVQLWYARKGDAEETHLKSLRAEQRTKIEEIKKKTNFYSTKSLLDRYDEGTGSGRKPMTPNNNQNLRQRPLNGTPAQNSQKQGLLTPGPTTRAGPGTRFQEGPRGPNQVQTPLQGKRIPPGIMTQKQVPMTPPRKQWFDKLADALLGDDEASTGSTPRSRFALICESCFSHNGLVREEDFDDMRYLCPKCGHFNASPRTKRDMSSIPPSRAGTFDSRFTRGSRPPSLAPTFGDGASERQGSSSPPLPSPSSRFSVGSRVTRGRRRDESKGSREGSDASAEKDHESEQEQDRRSVKMDVDSDKDT